MTAIHEPTTDELAASDEPATGELIALAHASLAAHILDEDTALVDTALDQTVVGPDFLAALQQGADAYLAGQRRANTVAAYAEDWKVWRKFCAEKGVPVELADANLLVAFVVWMEHHPDYDYAPLTMTRRVAGTVRTLRDRLGAVAVPKGISRTAAEAINGYARRLARANIQPGHGPAALITPEMAVQLADTPPTDTLVGLRNRALILLWYHLGARRAELAELLVTDIADDGEALTVTIRDSKTGPRRPVVVRKPGSAYCPVAALYAWLDAARITEGPLFPRMNRHGQLLGPVAPRSVGAVITQAGRAAGIDIHLTGHGMRIGHITTSFENGASVKLVAEQTGHNPAGSTILGYWQLVDRRTNNTSALINLDKSTVD